MSEPEKMTADEFRDVGYLQEVNRRLLHPLGLELVVAPNDRGIYHFDGVRDLRSSAEGVAFRPGDLDTAKALRVETLLAERAPDRRATRGFLVQPLPADEVL